MNEIVNNKVNLCDSCSQVYPDCTSQPEDVYFGDGIGHDNICACSKYQPETHEKRTETHACDSISRQDTVDVIASMIAYHKTLDDAYWYVKSDAPSAQPEIIRCRNCKFASGDSRICMKFGHSPIGELDFCAWAERRTDEAD